MKLLNTLIILASICTAGSITANAPMNHKSYAVNIVDAKTALKPMQEQLPADILQQLVKVETAPADSSNETLYHAIETNLMRYRALTTKSPQAIDITKALFELEKELIDLIDKMNTNDAFFNGLFQKMIFLSVKCDCSLIAEELINRYPINLLDQDIYGQTILSYAKKNNNQRMIEFIECRTTQKLNTLHADLKPELEAYYNFYSAAAHKLESPRKSRAKLDKDMLDIISEVSDSYINKPLNEEQRTILILAAKYNCIDLVQWLTDRYTTLNYHSKDVFGRTALDWAREHNNNGMISFLKTQWDDGKDELAHAAKAKQEEEETRALKQEEEKLLAQRIAKEQEAQEMVATKELKQQQKEAQACKQKEKKSQTAFAAQALKQQEEAAKLALKEKKQSERLARRRLAHEEAHLKAFQAIEAQRLIEQKRKIHEELAESEYRAHVARPDAFIDANECQTNYVQWVKQHRQSDANICLVCKPDLYSKGKEAHERKIQEQLQRRKSARTPPLKTKSKQTLDWEIISHQSALRAPIIPKHSLKASATAFIPSKYT